MINIKVPFRRQSVVDMNLWLTDICGLTYRKDWWWDNKGDGYYLYTFVDKKWAATFALRWA
jgi:hypothetical protein